MANKESDQFVYVGSDDVRNVKYSHFHKKRENKSMARNMKSHLGCTINWSAHQMVLIASANGKDFDEPAHTIGFSRVSLSRTHHV